jgi:cation:H+ antiporter
MIVSLSLILFGLVLLVTGGEALLRGAVGLAGLLRLTPAVIGLTVVAAGTSVPELAVSGIAAHQGKTDIAVANVAGSNIFNVTVILGLCALIRPIAIGGNTVKLEYPVLVLVTLLALVIGQHGEVNRLDAIFCLAVYVAFTAYLVSLVRQQVNADESRQLKEQERELAPSAKGPKLTVSLGLVAVGVALLGGGAHFTVTGAADLARLLGWSERLIGLTIVSAGTGLPEVVASLVSSVRGRGDLAVGNVIGSNLFNILAILGLGGLFAPLPIPPGLTQSDFPWMMGVTLLLLPLMLTGMTIRRWEGGVLLAAYGVYLTLLLRQPE